MATTSTQELIRLPYYDTLARFKRLAAEQPDRVSTGLKYQDDLIGAMLKEHGFEDWDLIEGKHMWGTSQQVFDAHLKTHALLNRLQRWLDNGKPWSKAIVLAEIWVQNHPEAWSWVDWPVGRHLSAEDREEAINCAW